MLMRAPHEDGFTLLEVVCAIVILTVGLMGVAAMQAKSIQGNAFSSSFYGSGKLAQEWMEWIHAYLSQPDQDNLFFNGKLQKESFVRISSLDTNLLDDAATEIAIPSDTTALLTLLADKGFKNSDGGSFTAEQIPAAPGSWCRMTWRIAANRPVENTTTIEIQTSTTNAFARDKRNTLRFIISTNI